MWEGRNYAKFSDKNLLSIANRRDVNGPGMKKFTYDNKFTLYLVTINSIKAEIAYTSGSTTNNNSKYTVTNF